MPAITIYFNDSDGHALKFIAMLNDKPQANLNTACYINWTISNEFLYSSTLLTINNCYLSSVIYKSHNYTFLSNPFNYLNIIFILTDIS